MEGWRGMGGHPRGLNQAAATNGSQEAAQISRQASVCGCGR